jgi:hypothetical protein
MIHDDNNLLNTQHCAVLALAAYDKIGWNLSSGEKALIRVFQQFSSDNRRLLALAFPEFCRQMVIVGWFSRSSDEMERVWVDSGLERARWERT